MLFPAFIHTFVDLRDLPEGIGINISENGQTKIEAGLYALIHSFDPVDEDDLDSPNTLIGPFTPHFHSPEDRQPTLFLAHIESIRSPLLGMADVPFGVKLPRHEWRHLFLIRRRAAWPQAWDSVINSFRSPTDDTDDTVFETDYEKVVTMANGEDVIFCKTVEDVDAEITAKKKKDEDKKKTKEATKKKKKTAAVDETEHPVPSRERGRSDR